MAKTELKIGNLSDVGKKRTVNEDYYGSFTGKFGNLIIVCDGMGGHKGGATASRLAVETIKLHFEQLSNDFNPSNELKIALEKANSNIILKASESEELKEMGSTAVVLLIKDNIAYYAHIGDSRIYLIRENNIHQLTKDHSLVQQLVDSGIIDEEAAKNHPQKNVISRSLGADGKNQPDIAEPLTIFKNDIFILCTDGLSGYLPDNEFLELATKNDPQTACVKMVNLANDRGGKDNITVQIVKVIKGKKLPFRIQDKLKKLQINIIVGFIIVSLLSVYIFSGLPNPFSIIQSQTDSDSLKQANISDTSAISDSTSIIKISDSVSFSISINDSINLSKKTDTSLKKSKNKKEK